MDKRLLLQCALAVGVVGAVFATDKIYAALVPYAEAGSIGATATSFDELSGRFRALAEDKGAVYAYEVLRRAPLPPNIDLHLLGHEIGNVLYEQKGSAAIADCTQEFRNACSHTVVIGMLTEFGASNTVLAQIDDACQKAPGGSGAYTMCYHGLGHGVFAFFGYDLEKTVSYCKAMGTPVYGNEQYIQCVGGAIMELMGGGGHDKDLWLAARERYLSDTRPLAPCDTSLIPQEARLFCYTYITPRLFELAGADLGFPDPATFPTAFSFCEAATPARDREACFGGFGKEFIPLAAARDIRSIHAMSDEQYALAASWCALSPATDGQQFCIEEALDSVFWGGESDPAASFRFCGAVGSVYAHSCYASLSENVKKYTPQQQASLCGRFPNEYKTLCAL